MGLISKVLRDLSLEVVVWTWTTHGLAYPAYGRACALAFSKAVRDCCDKYTSIFVYSVENMRNAKLKDVRTEWKRSRFFYGKNRVMQLALGQSEAEEYKDGLHRVAKLLKGNVGLLFTNQPKDEVQRWFAEFTEEDFARSGFVSNLEVILGEGPMEGFSHSMEQQLRQLGLPTALKKGMVTLVKEHTVCKKGEVLTPEQARVLKLIDIKMAEFRVVLKACWSQSGGFEVLEEDHEVLEEDHKQSIDSNTDR